MWKALGLSSYVGFVVFLAYMLAVAPAQAFMVSSSTTGYVRTASAAAVATYQNARVVSQANAIAAAVVGTSSGVSVALRIVAGASWPALGVLAGLVLLQVYLDGTKADALKVAAASPGPVTVPGQSGTGTLTGMGSCPTTGRCTAGGYDQYVQAGTPQAGYCNQGSTSTGVTLPAGWTAWTNTVPSSTTCYSNHVAGYNTTVAVQGVGTPATVSQMSTYIQNNVASTITANQTAVGPQVTPTAATNVVTQAASTTEMPTAVVPAANVGAADVVVEPNAPAPAGTTTVHNTTQTSTTTTTTTTNPDGSVTTADTDTAPVSCATGTHEVRSFGGILQTHMETWKGSGLLAALNLLGTLVWPTTSPTYTLTSAFLGTFTFDFTAWAGMLLAIRSVIIAIAGFVAYKIIFVGGRA